MECLMKVKPYASLLLYVVIVLCFFFPFATVLRGDVKGVTFTGQQLATGTNLTESQMFGPTKTWHLPGDIFAATALIDGLLCVALSAIGRKTGARGSFLAALLGISGIGSLLSLKWSLVENIQKQTQGLPHVQYRSGYTTAFLLFLVVAAWNAFQYLQLRNKTPLTPDSGGAKVNQVNSTETRPESA
jgi:hypothetical protein